jgi:membrane protease YdiL (CAAX protease family)
MQSMILSQSADLRPSNQKLVIEVLSVYGLQLVLLKALVFCCERFSMQGALHVLVGTLFIALPLFVLDRTGRPYVRYGMHAAQPLRDFSYATITALLTFPPIAVAVFSVPALWGIAGRTFQWVIPEGFAAIAISHFVVVAIPEEFFYRGYLQGRLDDIFKRRFRITGIDAGPGWVLQAMLFALGHFVVDFQPDRLAVFFPALVFGWLRLRTGSIASAVIYHGLANVFMELLRAGWGF